jgi:antitoxin component YwqK of YwqJK toxin-antitoxin module
MKKLFAAMFVALLMAGCGEEAVSSGMEDGLHTEYHDNGQKKREGNYKDGKQEGLETAWWENGQKRWESTFKDGKEDGLETWWYSTGQKDSEHTYKGGKLMTAVVWKPYGEKCPETNVVDGNGIVVGYREDGTEQSRTTYKDGEEVD